VRDTHSLYLEMFAELGPLGLGLLLVALGAPVVAALQGRKRALVPAALAAYVAFLAHAGIDWDWEMPAVTVTGLLCAVAILVSARGPGADRIPPPARGALFAGTAVLAAFSFAGFMGSHALVASKDADKDDQPAKAEAEARKATRWLPWSTEPWQAVAEAHFDRDDFPRARAALLEALERDRGDWAIWYDLGAASTGRERERAFREAARLNPYSRNVGVLRTLGVLPQLPSTTESGSSGGRR
jgi:hypothetical protein